MIDAFYSFSQFAQKLDFQITFVKIPRASQDESMAAGNWMGLGKGNTPNGKIEWKDDINAKANIMPGKLLLPDVM